MINDTFPRTGFWASPPVRLVLGILSVLAPVVIAQVLIVSLPVSRLWHSVLLGFVPPAVALGAYVAFVRLIEHRQVAELERRHAPRELMLGILIGALLFAAVMATLALAGSLAITGMNAWSVLLVPLMGAVASGVFEEILFRGVLYRILEEGLGSWLALLISGLIFGGLHLINPNSTLMGAVAVFLTAGILLGAGFILTRRLWWPIGLHFAWNFVQSGIFGLAVSGSNPLPGILKSFLSGPSWLTGGEFGPEASIATVILGLVVGVVVIWRGAAKGHIVKAPWVRRKA